MKHKNSHLLVGYWSRLRNGRAVPDQTDIDPRAIKRMLSHVFILDAASPARPIFRLAGTGLCERYGLELKGSGFLANWEGQSAAALAALLAQALKQSQPVCISSIGATGECGMVELETILLPITFHGDSAARFIGLTQVLSDPALLAGRPIAFQRLVGSQFVREDEPLAPPMPPPTPAVQIQRNHRLAHAPHLRLVVSQQRPAPVNIDSNETLRRMAQLLGGRDSPPGA
ncbi:MAG: PAS domain-containing protein [Alphaproteobacteria bacterium]|nr:PAS domain-containing protein [Alphaproteobacteria bacterium]MBV9693347.1 PAS domain-containing protein [Alphaproteobacteria bacterium]